MPTEVGVRLEDRVRSEEGAADEAGGDDVTSTLLSVYMITKVKYSYTTNTRHNYQHFLSFNEKCADLFKESSQGKHATSTSVGHTW